MLTRGYFIGEIVDALSDVAAQVSTRGHLDGRLADASGAHHRRRAQPVGRRQSTIRARQMCFWGLLRSTWVKQSAKASMLWSTPSKAATRLDTDTREAIREAFDSGADRRWFCAHFNFPNRVAVAVTMQRLVSSRPTSSPT